MDPDVLRDLEERGRFFWEMLPGAQAGDEWQRQRDRPARTEEQAHGQRPPDALREAAE